MKASRPPLVEIDRPRLREQLAAKPHLSQAEVARRAGMTSKKLNALVKDRNRGIRRDERRNLARALGVPIRWLEGRRAVPIAGCGGSWYQACERAGLIVEAADVGPSGAWIASPAPVALPLLDVLLAGLRAAQPEENCYLCLTSEDPRDVCTEHLRRLAAIAGYTA